MRVSWIKQWFITMAMAGVASGAVAEWRLNAGQSTLFFASVKSDTISEVHSFKQLQGSLAKDGRVEVQIGLASVETLIPIRNTRMKEMLFDVAKFPQAQISAAVDYQRFDRLGVGESLTQALSVKVALHGEQQIVETEVQVVKLSGNRLLVSALRPVLINTGDFALGKGVEALRKVANLPSISPIVPVTVNLVFEQ